MTAPVGGATEPRDLPSLTALRWYAALLVFFFHTQVPGCAWAGINPLKFGYAGVTFFFVLSGFVLTWSSPVSFSTRRFYLRRAARIFPTHLVTLGVVTLLILQGSASLLSTEASPLGAVLQIPLLNAWLPGYGTEWNGVTWSLSAEVFFYAMFPLILPSWRRMTLGTQAAWVLVLLTISLVVNVGGVAVLGSTAAGALTINPLIRFPEFLLGIALACRMRSARLPTIPLSAGVGSTLALAVVSWRVLLPIGSAANYAMLPGFALLILSAAQRDLRGHRGWLTSRTSTWLGEISFPFYLVHTTAIGIVMKGFGWNRPWGIATGWIPVLVARAVAGAAAAALHHAVETPARRHLVRRFDHSHARNPQPHRAPRES